MPKKQQRNPFWFFMLDWKTRQEAQGRVFPEGFRDVQADPECSSTWTNMTAEEKKPYMDRAKKSKDNNQKGKQTGTGESIQRIKDDEQRANDFKLNMDAHIRYTVLDAQKCNSVKSLKFLFLHMNWYYMREPDCGPVDFCPAEFAIAEFSIEEGITDYYHEIIKTDLHLGYAREALETSEKTHKLRWDLPFGEGNWETIFNKFVAFMSPGISKGKLPPIYTSKKIVHIIPSLLRRMTDAVGQSAEMFLVYTVEALFGTILRTVNDFSESNMVKVIAETHIEKELFEYTPNIECDYHKSLDGTSKFCSLSVVRQWGLTFCDACCMPLKVSMRPGVHCPETQQMIQVAQSYHDDSISMISSALVPSVLSATGVSQEHRIRKSERKYEDSRGKCDDSKVLLIDHSKRNQAEFTEQSEPEELYTAIAPPVKPQRDPPTASQALIGSKHDVPPNDFINFPVICGRGKPIQRDSPPIWAHRSRKSSDSD